MLTRFIFSRKNFASLSAVVQSGEKISEDIEDFYQESVASFPDKKAKEEKSKTAWLRKFKTIEKKHFQKPGEINLLSWSAKEQIKFLHSKYPDIWTPQLVAEHFPISEEGAAKFLRSKWAPRSTEEMTEHDAKVKDSWKNLRKQKNLPIGGPIMPKNRSLEDVKSKEVEIFEGEKLPSEVPSQQPLGLFASLVADAPRKVLPTAGKTKKRPAQKFTTQKPTNFSELSDSPVEMRQNQVDKSQTNSDFSEKLDLPEPNSNAGKTFYDFRFKFSENPPPAKD